MAEHRPDGSSGAGDNDRDSLLGGVTRRHLLVGVPLGLVGLAGCYAAASELDAGNASGGEGVSGGDGDGGGGIATATSQPSKTDEATTSAPADDYGASGYGDYRYGGVAP